jgi:hypothetical protein
LIPELWIKLTFAVVWASFGVLHLYRIGEIASHFGMTEFDERWDFRVGVVIGLSAGATVASVRILQLHEHRFDLRCVGALPTSESQRTVKRAR